jgi:hypothetical protein
MQYKTHKVHLKFPTPLSTDTNWHWEQVSDTITKKLRTRPTVQAIEQHTLQVKVRSWNLDLSIVWQKTHLGVGKQVKHEAEFELHQVKEQLRNAEDNIAYLSDRVITYRYRWLEEYYHAKNLECHMPSGIYVPDLGQIPLGAPSPGFSTEFLAWDDMWGLKEEQDRHV